MGQPAVVFRVSWQQRPWVPECLGKSKSVHVDRAVYVTTDCDLGTLITFILQTRKLRATVIAPQVTQLCYGGAGWVLNPGRLTPEASSQPHHWAPLLSGREDKARVRVPEGAMTGLSVSGLTETA